MRTPHPAPCLRALLPAPLVALLLAALAACGAQPSPGSTDGAPDAAAAAVGLQRPSAPSEAPPPESSEGEATQDPADPAPSAAGTPMAGDRAAQLREASRQAREAVAAFYGEEPEALDVPLALVHRKELIAGLAADLRPQLRAQVPEEFVEEQTRTLAELLGGMMLARYAFGRERVEVCLDTVDALAELFDDPTLASPELLRAVLVHEWVHARDAREHAIDATLADLDSTDALQAYSAVLEGHAQHVARRICAERGWSEGFERYCRSITELPPGVEDPALRLVARVAAETYGFAYLEGERFVDAVLAAEGPTAVARLFSAPPRGPVEVVRPEWYLDPDARPDSEVDLEAGLDRFAELALPSTLLANRVSVVPGQLRAGLEGVDPAIADRFVGAVLTMRAQIGQDPSTPGAQRAAVLYEFESPGEALAGLIAQRAVMDLRDEQNSGDGALFRITDAFYFDLELAGGFRGLCAEKTVQMPVGTLHAVTVLLVRDTLMVELSVSSGPDDPDQLAGWARATVAAAQGEWLAAEPADDVARESELAGGAGSAAGDADAPDAEEAGPTEDDERGDG